MTPDLRVVSSRTMLGINTTLKKKKKGKRKTISEKNEDSVTKMPLLKEILKDAFHEERK